MTTNDISYEASFLVEELYVPLLVMCICDATSIDVEIAFRLLRAGITKLQDTNDSTLAPRPAQAENSEHSRPARTRADPRLARRSDIVSRYKRITFLCKLLRYDGG